MNRCEVVRGSDCEGQTECECFRCGLPVCRGCSVVIPYLRYGHKRIGLNCLDEMASNGELDELAAIDHAAVLARYPRGISRSGGRVYGWRVTCACGWTQRVNGTKRDATVVFNGHRREPPNER